MKPRIRFACAAPAAAFLIALVVWPFPAEAQLSGVEKRYHQSLQAYHQGRYQEALEGFMDVFLDDPDYPDARKYLSLSGRAMLNEDKLRVYRERREILTDILKLQRQREPLMKQKAAETQMWDAAFQKVLAHARDPQNLSTALFAYEKALEIFPLYAEKFESFLQARSKFDTAYEGARWRASQSEKAGKRAYNPSKFDAHKADSQSLPSVGRLILLDRAESEAAVRIRTREDDIERALRASQVAFKRFDDRNYEDAARLWARILEERPLNLEARYYLNQARAHVQSAIEEPEAEAEPPVAPAVTVLSAARQPPVFQSQQAKPPTPALAPAPPVVDSAAAKAAPLPLSAQEYYLKGLRAYSVGDLTAAVQYWRNCLEVEAEHPKAKKALSRALREMQ